jgi:menaquinone-specific isochorismate synthase
MNAMMTYTSEFTTARTLPARHRVVAYSRPVLGCDLIACLRAARGQARFFWRGNGATWAGWGEAARATAHGDERFAEIRGQLEGLFANLDEMGEMPAPAQPRVFGGFAFRPDHRPSGLWSAFDAASFVLPRVQLTETGGDVWLTVNRLIPAEQPSGEARRNARLEADHIAVSLATAADEQPGARPLARSILYEQGRADWEARAAEAVRRIKAGALEKVVLARTADLLFDEAPDVVAFVGALDRSYPETYRFLFEPLPGHAFYGATPELLVELRGDRMRTAALAGSRPRGRTPTEDRVYADQLRTSAKERAEHRVVVDSLQSLIVPFASEIDMPTEPDVYRLANIQHLYTPITARLDGRFDVLDLVEALHPTPALGGSPRLAALAAIRELEPFERGWYAAPVGMIDRYGEGTFAVAIRSAVTVGDHARLYAGVGIVAGSDPASEWEETGLKFRPLMAALGA